MTELSVVVPLYKEEETVAILYEAITAALADIDKEYEIIFVDDGSPDRTFEIAAGLAEKDTRLKIVKFRANAGQTPAMAAGIEHAKGETIITMDGDMQNDPADIPMFLEKMEEGYDIVAGWRHRRQDKLITRKIPSVIANRLIGKVTGVPIRDNGCSLKAYRSRIIKNVQLYSDMHRFIPAMMSIAGSRVAEIKVRHHARQFGESKYGLSRIYKVLLDLFVVKTIVSFTARPMLWFSLLALPAFLLSTGFLATSIVHMIVNGVFPIPMLASGILFGALAGFLVLEGILSELVHKTGDIDLSEYSLLTAKTITSRDSRSAKS